MEIPYKILEQLFDHKLEPIVERLDRIEDIIGNQTITLDFLATQNKDLKNEATLIQHHLEKHDKALSLIAKKIDLDLKPILK